MSLQNKLETCTKKSFIVRAPAGSGKTELLLKQYLKLLLEVENPADCLILTFSKKAVISIRERVEAILTEAWHGLIPSAAHRLETYLLAQNVHQYSQNKNWCLIENLHLLNINTLDSFAFQLLKTDSSINPMYRVLEEPRFLYKFIVRRFLCDIEYQSDLFSRFMNLAKRYHFKKSQLENLLIQSLYTREHWLPYLETLSNQDQYKKSLQDIWCILIKTLIESLNISHEMQTFCLQIEDLGYKYNEQHVIVCQTLLSSIFTKDYKIRQKIVVAYKDTDFSKLNMSRLLPILEMICYFPVFRLEEWLGLQDIYLVLSSLIHTMNKCFIEEKACDFSEILFLCCKSRIKIPLIKNILIDEFQDISPLNLQFLETVISYLKPKTDLNIVLVGDPLQSIYRFRNADISCFLKVLQVGIASINLQFLHLNLNFRSQPQLVAWCNNLFYQLLPNQNDSLYSQASFSEIMSRVQENNSIDCVSNLMGPQVHHYKTEQEQYTDIIQSIKLYQQQYPYNTVALIVRARSHVQSLLPLLKQYNILYDETNIWISHNDIVYKLLFAFLVLLHDINNELYWVYILTSDIFSYNLQDIYIIQQKLAPTFIEKLLIFSQSNSRIASFIKQIQDRTETTLELSLCLLWKTYGLAIYGPTVLISFLDICTPFWNHDKLFIRDLDLLLERLNKPQNLHTHSTKTSSLHIMTIHQAKGLEFDFVILPQMQRASAPSLKKDLIFQHLFYKQDGQYIPFLSDFSHYKFWHSLEKAREKQELIRLFYVAVTRAKHRLMLTYVQPKSIHPSSFLKLLFSFPY